MAAKVLQFKRKSGSISGYGIDFSNGANILGLDGVLSGDVVTVGDKQYIRGVTFFDNLVEAADAIEAEIEKAIEGYEKMLHDFQQKRRIQKV